MTVFTATAAMLREFPNLERFWNDPVFRDSLDAETAERRVEVNQVIDRAVRVNHPWVTKD